MTDGFDDKYVNNGAERAAGNMKAVPKRKTAIALKDSHGGQNVPKVAAAGRGAMAEKILALAFEHGIKVREDSDLAEMLVQIELDSPIPSEAFIAVGEILSYIYKANGQSDPFNAIIHDDNTTKDNT